MHLIQVTTTVCIQKGKHISQAQEKKIVYAIRKAFQPYVKPAGKRTNASSRSAAGHKKKKLIIVLEG
jgi:hypothetical protein